MHSWTRRRFYQARLAGLEDAARPGKPKTYDEKTEKRFPTLLDADPPEGYSQWNGRLLVEKLGDVSDDQVWRVLRKHKIQLQRRRSWCISTDPEFGPKAADVVGLYLSPPEDAVVLCVHEKPHIQVLERAPRDGCAYPTAKPSMDSATATNDMAPVHYLPPWSLPPAKCSWVIIRDGGDESFWIS